MKEWKILLMNDESASVVVATTGSKRKAVSRLVVSLDIFLGIEVSLFSSSIRMLLLVKQKYAANTKPEVLLRYSSVAYSKRLCFLPKLSMESFAWTN
jgi:hypothetical protein